MHNTPAYGRSMVVTHDHRPRQVLSEAQSLPGECAREFTHQ